MAGGRSIPADGDKYMAVIAEAGQTNDAVAARPRLSPTRSPGVYGTPGSTGSFQLLSANNTLNLESPRRVGIFAPSASVIAQMSSGTIAAQGSYSPSDWAREELRRLCCCGRAHDSRLVFMKQRTSKTQRRHLLRLAQLLLTTAIVLTNWVFLGLHIYELHFSKLSSGIWQSRMYVTYVHYFVTTFVTCHGTAYLVYNACTAHFVLVAMYATLIWLMAVSITLDFQSRTINGDLARTCNTIGLLFFMRINERRVAVIQKDIGFNMGAKWMVRIMPLVAVQLLANFSKFMFWRGVWYEVSLVVFLLVVFKCLHCYWICYRHCQDVKGRAHGSLKRDAKRAAGICVHQICGVIFVVVATSFHFLVIKLLEMKATPHQGYYQASMTLFTSMNVVGALLFSGATNGGLEGAKQRRKTERARRRERERISRKYVPNPNEEWHTKVCELAHRGFTLRALLKFYKGLGTEYMVHYTPGVSTTRDVVWEAIIPLSRDKRCAHATIMMGGRHVLPEVMVTHAWGNLFRDLVAAIVADALGESEFLKIAYVMEKDIEEVERWVELSGSMENTYWVCAFSVSQHDGICGDVRFRYWVCAFSVSQHDGICGANPKEEKDSVTGRPYSPCSCGKPKYFNNTPPIAPAGESILCEMNKFSEMMAYLAARDNAFRQIVAVDQNLCLFHRAWCIAEIAEAHAMSMVQMLKMPSADIVKENAKKLRLLRVEEMEASRPQDVDRILAMIPDKTVFNERLRSLIFDKMLKNWDQVDAVDKMRLVGQVVRWRSILKDAEVAQATHDGTESITPTRSGTRSFPWQCFPALIADLESTPAAMAGVAEADAAPGSIADLESGEAQKPAAMDGVAEADAAPGTTGEACEATATATLPVAALVSTPRASWETGSDGQVEITPVQADVMGTGRVRVDSTFSATRVYL